MKNKVIIILVVAAVAAVAVYFLTRKAPEAAPASSAETPVPQAIGKTVVPKSAETPASVAKPEVKKPAENGWAEKLGTNRLAAAEKAIANAPKAYELSAAEEALVIQAKEFAANHDVASARAFAAAQQSAAAPQVREAAVFALANCGEPCLAELTPYLADQDEGVRTEAMSAWRAEWFAMPNDADKAEAGAAIMCVVNDNAALEPIAAELMKFDRDTALEALSAVLENGTEAGRAQAARISQALGAGAK